MTKVAAIFDLDDTILNASSGALFYRYLRQTGAMSRFFRPSAMARAVLAMARWRLGLSDVNQAMAAAASIAGGIEVEPFWQLIQQWFDEMVVHTIRDEARAALAAHRAQGHLPVICSASSQFSVLPVARHLGIAHTLYTEWLAADGCLTGELRFPLVYGSGKLHWARLWAEQLAVDLASSTFYSDHHSDSPLMEAVGHAVAVNPGRKLARLAQANGWAIVQWSE